MNPDLEEKREEEKENHERWLISYADFLTLLFTFFVALYALSVLDAEKAVSFSESLSRVFKIIDKPIKTQLEKPEIIEQLEISLRQYQGVVIKENPRGIIIELKDHLLFKSGEYTLNPNSYAMLDKIIEQIRGIHNKISIEGHTDNVPIRTEFIRSNWDLSSLRALSVLYYFINSGISPDRLSATGFGEYKPVADNETEEGRAKNRRVEIIILR
jgi:chemotaxis protein MotB